MALTLTPDQWEMLRQMFERGNLKIPPVEWPWPKPLYESDRIDALLLVLLSFRFKPKRQREE